MFRGFAGRLVVLTIIALLVRLACLHIAMPITLTGDEVYYTTVAYNIAGGYGHSRIEEMRASWPPANAYFLSMFIDPQVLEERVTDFQQILKPMLVGQAILGCLLVPLVMILSRKLFDDRMSLIAGIITAFYPTFIAFSHYAWAENLFAVLVAAALAAAVYAQQSSRLGMAAITGVLFGLAALTRETGLVIAAACGLWWVWAADSAGRKRAVARCGLMLLVAIATIMPWTIRNYRVLGGFVPVSTVGWMAVSEGNMFETDDWLHPNRDLLVEFRAIHGRIPDELERMEYARRTALELIRKEQPTWILKKFVRTSGQLFGPDSFLFRKISRGTYPVMPMAVIRFLLVATVFAYIAVVVAGILGIAITPDRRFKLLPCLVIGSVFLLHLAANASSRYRLPLMPLLIPYAGYAIIHWREIRPRLAGRSWIAPAVVLLWFFALCVPYFAGDAVSLWLQGTYQSPLRP
jgi:4-amino-4-deoxy-L-arabinose transferase-like glycosyltransferase